MAILSLKRVAIAFILGGVALYAGSQCWLATRKRKAKRSTNLSIFAAPGAGQRGAGYLREFPRSVLFSRPPSFALIAASVLVLVGFPLWINSDTWRYSKGIQVLASSQSRLTPRYGQGSKPLTLRIDKERRWFFEGEEVSPEGFPAALKQALRSRSDGSYAWTQTPIWIMVCR